MWSGDAPPPVVSGASGSLSRAPRLARAGGARPRPPSLAAASRDGTGGNGSGASPLFAGPGGASSSDDDSGALCESVA
eukprot:6012369-Alexandrium_andersonii.AAC.1